MSGGNVFISYSRRDSEYVTRLVSYLRGHNLPVWADSSLNYGDHWEDVICREIDNCAAFVPVMSPDAWDSPWVRNEVSRARLKQRPILPLLLAGDYFFGLSHLEAENVTEGQLPTEAFVERLRGLTRQLPGTVYGLPAADDTRPRRRWLWPALAAAAVLLIVGTIVTVSLSSHPGAAPRAGVTTPSTSGQTRKPGSGGERLVAPPSIGDLSLLYVSPTATGNLSDSFGYQITDRTGSTYLVYQNPADSSQLINVLAATGTVTASESTVDYYLSGVDAATVKPADPGTFGGFAKCGALGKVNPSYVECAWADPGSLGVVFCYHRTLADCSTLFTKVRDAVLTRD
jgi:hypothetical protein